MKIPGLLALLVILSFSTRAASSQLIIDSQPETATIYRDGYGYLEETLFLQTSKPGAIRLPPGTEAGSIVVLQGGTPVEKVVIEEEKNEKSLSYLVTLPKEITSKSNPASLVIRYSVTGLSWQPQLDISVPGTGALEISLKALVQNNAVNLENSRILLASGSGPMGKRLYFDLVGTPGRQRREAPLYGGADIVYDIGRRSIEKKPNMITMFPIDSSTAKYRTRYIWDTRSRGRIQRVILVENPFKVSLCPSPVNLRLDNVLLKAGEADWTEPGDMLAVRAGGETALLGEKAIVTTEDPSKKPRAFNHDIEYTVTNRSRAKAVVDVLFEKKLGYKHRNEYHFTKEPDKSPGPWYIWSLDISAGSAKNVKFSVDSERKDFEEYRTYDSAALGD